MVKIKSDQSGDTKDPKLTRSEARKLQRDALDSVNSNFSVIMAMLENQNLLLTGGTPTTKRVDPGTHSTPDADIRAGLDHIDIDSVSSQLAALGSPVRLEILRLCADGPMKVRELADKLGKGTTGQVYHHLRQLTVANWLRSAGKATYEINEKRIPALLAIFNASES